MRIMPVSGMEMGISPKQWKRIEMAVSKKAQSISPEDQDRYFDDMWALRPKSSQVGKTEREEQTEVVRDPGSVWGGRERSIGFDSTVDVTVTLEGNITYPYGGSDEEAIAAIARDFDENWGENNACFEAVQDAASGLMGDGDEVKHSTIVQSMSMVGDKQYAVVLVFSATVTKYESSSDAKQRIDEEKADRMRED